MVSEVKRIAALEFKLFISFALRASLPSASASADHAPLSARRQDLLAVAIANRQRAVRAHNLTRSPSSPSYRCLIAPPHLEGPTFLHALELASRLLCRSCCFLDSLLPPPPSLSPPSLVHVLSAPPFDDNMLVKPVNDGTHGRRAISAAGKPSAGEGASLDGHASSPSSSLPS